MILEYETSFAPADVLSKAKSFFAWRNPIYAAFLEKEGDTFVTFRGQGGEELVIGVAPVDGGTAVRASTYLFDMQARRFFAMLPPLPTAEAIA
jgi:hypothetical protein